MGLARLLIEHLDMSGIMNSSGTLIIHSPILCYEK